MGRGVMGSEKEKWRFGYGVQYILVRGRGWVVERDWVERGGADREPVGSEEWRGIRTRAWE